MFYVKRLLTILEALHLVEFFKHANQACPPSLSNGRDLRFLRKKSELASCLQELTNPRKEAPTDIEVIVIDGAGLVNMLKPKREDRTFSAYANTFSTYVRTQL